MKTSEFLCICVRRNIVIAAQEAETWEDFEELARVIKRMCEISEELEQNDD